MTDQEWLITVAYLWGCWMGLVGGMVGRYTYRLFAKTKPSGPEAGVAR